jgi:hypothetical protein
MDGVVVITQYPLRYPDEKLNHNQIGKIPRDRMVIAAVVKSEVMHSF